MNKLKNYLPIFIIIIVSFSSWFFGLHHYFNLETIRTHQVEIEQFIKNNHVSSIIIYSVLYIVIVALSIPGANLMTLTAGLLFGYFIGTAIAVFSASIGASIFFLSAKMASQDLLAKKPSPWVQKMQNGFQNNAFFYLLMLRFTPIVPFVAINIAAALCHIPLKIFFLGTFLGVIPGSVVYISIGVALRKVIQQPDFKLDSVFDPKILAALIILGCLSILPIMYKMHKQRR